MLLANSNPDWKPPFILLETSMGNVVLELYWNHAPRTCRNMAELAQRGYYNNTIAHRIIADFMIQMGDPTGTGRGGSSIYGGEFEDEIRDDLKFSGAGILAMANSGKHTIFGRVASGMRVVQKMGLVPTDPQDKPSTPVTIVRALPRNHSRL